MPKRWYRALDIILPYFETQAIAPNGESWFNLYPTLSP